MAKSRTGDGDASGDIAVAGSQPTPPQEEKMKVRNPVILFGHV